MSSSQSSAHRRILATWGFEIKTSKLLAVTAVLCAAVGCDPGDGKREYEEATAAYEAHQNEKAEPLFAKSADLCKTNIDALVMLAKVRLDLGRLEEAKEAVERAAAIASEDIDVIELSAQVAWHEKDYAAARENYLRLAEDAKLEPTVRSQAFAGLGVIDMAMSDEKPSDEWLRDRARTELLRAIALDPKSASARYHLGLLYRDAPFGYNDAALEQFQFFVRLAVEADPRMLKVQRNIIPELREMINAYFANLPGASTRNSAASAAALKKADDAWSKGNYTAARKGYDEAYSADPLSYPAALGLAKAWDKTDGSKNGRQKAYDYYNAACRLRSSAVKTFIAAGDLAMKLGQPASAVNLYSRAMAASARDITAIDGLIRALRKCNRPKAAGIYQDYRDTIPVRKK